MLIYNNKGIRVLQHEYLQVFHVQKFMEGDNPRSYGRTMDYFTVKECYSIEEVREVVSKLLEE